jgi:hypothetical protein
VVSAAFAGGPGRAETSGGVGLLTSVERPA